MPTALKPKKKYRSGGFKGLQRKKSDDQPGKPVRKGIPQKRAPYDKMIPNKGIKVAQQPDGLPRGECFVRSKKHLIAECRCGGHYKRGR